MTETTIRENLTVAKWAIEKKFAFCALLAPDLVIKDAGWLDPKYISDELVSKYWERVKNGENPGDVAIDIGLSVDLLRIGDTVTSALNANAYALKIMDLHYLQIVSQQFVYVIEGVTAHNPDRVQFIIGRLSKARLGIPSSSIKTATEIGTEFEESLENEITDETVPTGIRKIDLHIGGLWKECLTIVCGRPSMGKTAMLWQWARNQAAAGFKVIVFSMEQSERILWLRAACGALGFAIADYMANKLTSQQRDILREKSVTLKNLYSDQLLIVGDTKTTTADVWRIVAQEKPDVILCDHLSKFGDKASKDREDLRLGKITAALKAIAKEFYIPVVCAAQLSRASTSRQEKRPTLTDLRDSGKIEEDADFVIGLHRNDYYSPPDTPSITSPLEALVLKFRDGATVKINLIFHRKELWFYCDDTELAQQPELLETEPEFIPGFPFDN